MSQTSTSLSQRQSSIAAPQNLDEVFRLAKAMYDSGLFPDTRSAGQAVVKILAGAEMGFGPLASMADVHIIEGKPSIGAHLKAAAIRRRGGIHDSPYDFDVIRSDAEVCDLEFWELTGVANGAMRKGKPGWSSRGHVTYTMKEVIAAGFHLGAKGIKTNWKNSPADMLFARCLSRGYRRHCPDLTGGVLSYDPDELDNAQSVPAATTPDVPKLGVQDAEIVPKELAAMQAALAPAPATLPAPSPDRPHTPEQAARMDELATTLNISADNFAKRLREMSMPPDWHDLTQAQAAKVITLMESRLADRKVKVPA